MYNRAYVRACACASVYMCVCVCVQKINGFRSEISDGKGKSG